MCASSGKIYRKPISFFSVQLENVPCADVEQNIGPTRFWTYPKKTYICIAACSVQCILCKAIGDVKHSKRLEQYICIELRTDDDDLNDRMDRGR